MSPIDIKEVHNVKNMFKQGGKSKHWKLNDM